MSWVSPEPRLLFESMESLLYLGLIHIMRGGQASIAAHTHHNNHVVPKTSEKNIINLPIVTLLINIKLPMISRKYRIFSNILDIAGLLDMLIICPLHILPLPTPGIFYHWNTSPTFIILLFLFRKCPPKIQIWEGVGKKVIQRGGCKNENMGEGSWKFSIPFPQDI